MNKIIFKLGRIAYMAIMIILAMILTFACFTTPVMKHIPLIAQGVAGFNLLIITWFLSIVIGGILFFAMTSAIYCILTYIQLKPKHGKHAAARAASYTFVKMMKKI